MEERALEALVHEVEGAEDPIQTVHRLVLEGGGFWNQYSPANQVDLFQRWCQNNANKSQVWPETCS